MRSTQTEDANGNQGHDAVECTRRMMEFAKDMLACSHLVWAMSCNGIVPPCLSIPLLCFVPAGL